MTTNHSPLERWTIHDYPCHPFGCVCGLDAAIVAERGSVRLTREQAAQVVSELSYDLEGHDPAGMSPFAETSLRTLRDAIRAQLESKAAPMELPGGGARFETNDEPEVADV